MSRESTNLELIQDLNSMSTCVRRYWVSTDLQVTRIRTALLHELSVSGRCRPPLPSHIVYRSSVNPAYTGTLVHYVTGSHSVFSLRFVSTRGSFLATRLLLNTCCCLHYTIWIMNALEGSIMRPTLIVNYLYIF